MFTDTDRHRKTKTDTGKKYRLRKKQPGTDRHRPTETENIDRQKTQRQAQRGKDGDRQAKIGSDRPRQI